MSNLTHPNPKIMAERMRMPAGDGQQDTPIETATATGPPPPYADNHHHGMHNLGQDEEVECEGPTIDLTINAATQIHGHNNLVPQSQAQYQDASRITAVLMQALQQFHERTLGAAQTEAQHSTSGKMNISLTINCGTTIVGSRNVIGNFGVRARGAAVAPLNTAGANAAAAGATGFAATENTQLPTPTEPGENSQVPVAAANKPASAPLTIAADTSLGAKRKAEDEGTEDEAGAAKRAKRVVIDETTTTTTG